jgi:Protein of unknown function (DUF3515)
VRVRAGVAVGVAVGLALAACGGGDVTSGPDGDSAACSALTGRLPSTVLARARTRLDVTGAARWGDPSIVLRCGVPPTGPTSDPCIEADGVDWTFRENGGSFRFTTFGRDPAVEVTVPGSIGRTNASAALIDLAAAVKPLASTSKCIGPGDA